MNKKKETESRRFSGMLGASLFVCLASFVSLLAGYFWPVCLSAIKGRRKDADESPNER